MLSGVALACESRGLLFVLPALLLVGLLLARRYPGERLLTALRERHSQITRWPRARSARSARARALTAVVHGGLLIARSLAVRPPPRLLRAIG
ncbi:MAG TPA: hypothetical protein VHT25_01380 [Solirubrobacteraceae bacterium]|nr:hypothetical protein [Solirubrobacteraceae bacterium]